MLSTQHSQNTDSVYEGAVYKVLCIDLDTKPDKIIEITKELMNEKNQNRLDRFSAYRIIKEACAEAGLEEHVGTHTLRKTFGYHFYQEKKDIALLQTIFNHSTPTVTLRYIGINQDMIDSNLKSFSL